MPTISEEQWRRSLASHLNAMPVRPASSTPAPEASGAATALHANPVLLASAVNIRPSIASVVATPNRIARSEEILDRPAWNAAALPTRKIEAVPVLVDPIRVDAFNIWHNDGQVYYGLAVPRLVSFSLTVESTVQPDRSIKVTGGTAVITVGVYPETSPTVLASLKVGVIKVLPRPIIPPHRPVLLPEAGRVELSRAENLKFLVQDLRNLWASIELPPAHLASPPQVAVSTAAGTATFIVSLTSLGVLAWRDALNQRNGGSIAGICHLSGSYFARLADSVGVRQQPLDVTLGTLLATRGPEDIRTIDPQQSVEAKLLVVGHDLLQSVTVDLRPNMGQAPESQVFDKGGGAVSVTITTTNVSAVQVDWDAKVAFNSAGWPVIPTSGRMSSAGGLAEMIKPDSWIANYFVVALLVDASGKPTAIDSSSEKDHINGVLTFTAPYVPSNILVSSFTAENQAPVAVALPRFPGQPFGDLVLNMFATRNGVASTSSRRLTENDLFITALIYPDAQIVIKTAADTLPELSPESSMLGLISMLR